MNDDSHFRNVRDRLNNVSPSFCLAKWNQVTIHLNSGTTHSCHHCPPHKVPLNELKNNPSALHNTNEKKQTRKLMLEGKRPEECNFCWRAEDLKKDDVFSDRIKKSWSDWNDDTIETIPQMPWDVNIAPKYVELDFSNACNFKCIYCSPAYSTTWMKEIREHGPYKLEPHDFNSLEEMQQQGTVPFEGQEEDNPYIQAFWKWLPDIIGNLKVMRVTGGEPLLSKNTFKLIDYFVDHPQPNVKFDINSNLGAPDASIDKLIQGVNRLFEANAVKEMTVYTSCEAKGAKAGYIRHGLNYEKWLSNVDRLLTECPRLKVSVMSTYNALSVTSYKPFLEDMLALLQKHVTPYDSGISGRGWHPLQIDFPYLRYPYFLCPWILTEDYLKYVKECVDYIEVNQFQWASRKTEDGKYETYMSRVGFSDYSVHDAKRLYGVLENAIVNNIGRSNPVEMDRKAFWKFIDEHDHRRGMKFLEIFPEMEEFYNFCKNNYP